MSSNSFEFTTPDDEDRSHAHMTTLQYMMNAVGTTLPTVVPRHTRVVGANWQRRSWATEEYLNVRTQPVSSTVETRQQRRLARVSGASDSLSLTAVESSHRGVESAIVLQSLRPLQGLQGAAGSTAVDSKSSKRKTKKRLSFASKRMCVKGRGCITRVSTAVLDLT